MPVGKSYVKGEIITKNIFFFKRNTGGKVAVL